MRSLIKALPPPNAPDMGPARIKGEFYEKKKIVLGVFIAWLMICLCGCGARGEKPTEYTGIISAMDNEVNHD